MAWRHLLLLIKDVFIIFHHFFLVCLVSHALSRGEWHALTCPLRFGYSYQKNVPRLSKSSYQSFFCRQGVNRPLAFLLSCSYTGSDWFAQNIHGNSVLNTAVFWLKYLPSNSIALPTTKAICCYLPLCPNHYRDYLSKHCLSLQYPACPLLRLYPLGAMSYTASANSFYLEKGLKTRLFCIVWHLILSVLCWWFL